MSQKASKKKWWWIKRKKETKVVKCVRNSINISSKKKRQEKRKTNIEEKFRSQFCFTSGIETVMWVLMSRMSNVENWFFVSFLCVCLFPLQGKKYKEQLALLLDLTQRKNVKAKCLKGEVNGRTKKCQTHKNFS